MSKTSAQCLSCQNLHKKLKILQADYDFEIKKLNEDKSAEKALYELNMNRQIKKLQDKCQKEKEERVKENESWMQKYDELIEKQKRQMANYKASKDKETEQYKKTKQAQIQKFKFQTVSKLQKTIQTLHIQKENVRTELTQKYETKIQEIKVQQDQKVAKLIQKHEDEMKKKCAQYEATILGIQSEKTVEENLHRKTKDESRQSQSRLNQEIYSLKKSIIDHEEKIVCLKAQIQEKCDKVEFLRCEILRKETEHTDQYKKLSKDYESKYEAHKQSMQKRLQKLIKRELQNCSKYEKALQSNFCRNLEIQEHREIQNQMYKANLNEIKSCVDERPSRFEDVDEIITLKEKLIKKQRECENLSEELKWYRLELENKEQTYNKIFGPDSKNNESIYIRRKDLKMKRSGKSVTTVRQILGNVSSGNNLAPLVGNMQRKLLPPKQNRIL